MSFCRRLSKTLLLLCSLEHDKWGKVRFFYMKWGTHGGIFLITPRPRIYYWRTRSGEEVDFVIEQGRKLIAAEIKAGPKVRYQDTSALQTFLKAYPETRAALILYGGTNVERLSDKLFAIPLSALWE